MLPTLTQELLELLNVSLPDDENSGTLECNLPILGKCILDFSDFPSSRWIVKWVNKWGDQTECVTFDFCAKRIKEESEKLESELRKLKALENFFNLPERNRKLREMTCLEFIKTFVGGSYLTICYGEFFELKDGMYVISEKGVIYRAMPPTYSLREVFTGQEYIFGRCQDEQDRRFEEMLTERSILKPSKEIGIDLA